MYGSGIELPKVEFSTINNNNIEVGSYFFGFDLDNGGLLSKMDHLGNITVLEESSLSRDIGVVTSETHTGTTDETIIETIKFPANFYKVGDMMIPGHTLLLVGVYDQNGQGPTPAVPAPVEITNSYSYFNSIGINPIDSFPYVAYANTTQTFTQASTTGSGSGLEVEVTFNNSGYIQSWEVTDGGSNYLPYAEIGGDTVTSNEPIPGGGRFVFEVFRTDGSEDPQLRLRAYWSYDQSSPLDNLFQTATFSYDMWQIQQVFSVASLTQNQSGFFTSFSKITGPTSSTVLSGQIQAPPYNPNIISTIPNVTQDVWITITAELEDPDTAFALGGLLGIKKFSAGGLT
jgi:hypothetical protein